MADKNIGSLKKATYIAADSLMIAEQQGEAVAVEGALFIDFARQAVEPQADRAEAAATSAENVQKYVAESRTAAAKSASNAAASEDNAKSYSNSASTSEKNAKTSEENALASKISAASSAKRIEDMSVEAHTIHYSEGASVDKQSGESAVKLIFSIPGGKSAYQYAVDVGYTGTEEEFTRLLTDKTGITYVADGGKPGSFDSLVFDGGTPFTTDELNVDGGMP